LPRSKKREEYVQLLKGMHVDVLKVKEFFAQRQGAAILRPDASWGELELESDLQSQLAYQKRLRRIYTATAATYYAMFVCFALAMVFTGSQIFTDLSQVHTFSDFVSSGVALIVGIFAPVYFFIMGTYLTTQLTHNHRRVTSLETSHLIHE